MKGITFGDILDMETTDRTWILKRLYSQLKHEAQEMDKASKGRR
jgi:hypothetical protein